MIGERSDKTAPKASEKTVRDNIDCIDRLIGKTRDGRVIVALAAGTDNLDSHSEGIGNTAPAAFIDPVSWIFWIYQQGEGSRIRNQFAK